jgi:hypothetical protein
MAKRLFSRFDTKRIGARYAALNAFAVKLCRKEMGRMTGQRRPIRYTCSGCGD